MKKITNDLFIIPALLALALLVSCSGCSMFGTDPEPPGPTESKFFETITNYLQKVEWKTNTVTLTNTEIVTAFITNQFNVVVPINVTNITQIATPVPVLVTNFIPQYEVKPTQLTKDSTGTAGAIANLVVPGSGVIITALGGLLAGVWARLRSTKKTASVLAQGIEVYGEANKAILGATGKDIDAEVKAWMQKYQAEMGVLNQVVDILDKTVDNQDAQESAAALKKFIDDRRFPTPPTPPMPPTPVAIRR